MRNRINKHAIAMMSGNNCLMVFNVATPVVEFIAVYGEFPRSFFGGRSAELA
jgi:hypothetical protein